MPIKAKKAAQEAARKHFRCVGMLKENRPWAIEDFCSGVEWAVYNDSRVLEIIESLKNVMHNNKGLKFMNAVVVLTKWERGRMDENDESNS